MRTAYGNGTLIKTSAFHGLNHVSRNGESMDRVQTSKETLKGWNGSGSWQAKRFGRGRDVLIPLLFCTFFSVAAARAESESPNPGEVASAQSRAEFGLKLIKNSPAVATLFGGSYLHLMTPHFSVGGTVYSGQVSSGATGNFTLGGLLLSYHSSMRSVFHLEGNLMIGAAGGVADTITAGGVAIEPGIGAVLRLGRTTEVGFSVGYVYMPSSSALSGLSGGVRIEFQLDE